jgi:hypothetical protein
MEQRACLVPLRTLERATQTHVCLHVVSRIVGLNPKLEYVKETKSTAPLPSLMKIRWGGGGFCYCWDLPRRTDMQTNVEVLMSTLVKLHVVNSQNDSPDNICTVVSCHVYNVYCNF